MSANRLDVSALPQRMVLMGVAGCGKSSVGAALAAHIGASYADGDDLHPPANIAKMTRGDPLTDADRWPWLAAVGQALAGGDHRIIGCSALKRRYRDKITAAAGGPVTFIHLAGSHALIKTRMAARTGHFMPPSLLVSQFAALEPPGPQEDAVQVDIDQSVPQIVAEIVARLAQRGA